MKIDVKKTDIVKGQQHMTSRRRVTSCPIALAIQRVVTRDCSVLVDGEYVSIKCANEERILELPNKVTDFINRADNGLEPILRPFTFSLPIPPFAKK